jgi:hypothetical protein
MHNIFHDSDLMAVERFRAPSGTGFTAPSRRASDRQLYGDTEFWKSLETLY